MPCRFLSYAMFCMQHPNQKSTAVAGRARQSRRATRAPVVVVGRAPRCAPGRPGASARRMVAQHLELRMVLDDTSTHLTLMREA